MTYSCAVWRRPTVGLEAAQAAKHELMCQKLALGRACGCWTSAVVGVAMALHAAQHHGVEVVGVTVSPGRSSSRASG